MALFPQFSGPSGDSGILPSELGAPVVNVLGKVAPTPAWQPGTKQELRGQLTGRSVGLPLPQPRVGAPLTAGEVSPDRHPSLGGSGVSAQYCYYSVSTGQITALPMKKMRVLLAPLEQPVPQSPP